MDIYYELLNCLLFTAGVCLVCLNDIAGKSIENSWQNFSGRELGDNVIFFRALLFFIGVLMTIYSIKNLSDWLSK